MGLFIFNSGAGVYRTQVILTFTERDFVMLIKINWHALNSIHFSMNHLVYMYMYLP